MLRFVWLLMPLFACQGATDTDSDPSDTDTDTDADSDADTDGDTDEVFTGEGQVRFVNLAHKAGAECDHDANAGTADVAGCIDIYNDDRSEVALRIGPGHSVPYVTYAAAEEVAFRITAAGTPPSSPDVAPDVTVRDQEQLTLAISDEFDDPLLLTYMLGATTWLDDRSAPAAGHTRITVFNSTQLGALRDLVIGGVSFETANRLEPVSAEVPHGTAAGAFTISGFGEHSFSVDVTAEHRELYVVDRFDEGGLQFAHGLWVDPESPSPTEVAISKD